MVNPYAVFASELKLVARSGEPTPGDLGARVVQRQMEVPAFVVDWAASRHLEDAGHLLAAMEAAPGNVAQAWRWTSAEVSAAARRLRALIERW